MQNKQHNIALFFPDAIIQGLLLFYSPFQGRNHLTSLLPDYLGFLILYKILTNIIDSIIPTKTQC